MTTLTFTKNEEGRYISTIESVGDIIAVQLQRTDAGDLVFYGNIGTMPKVILQGLSKDYAGKDVFISLDLPSGVFITIESETEVTLGGYE